MIAAIGQLRIGVLLVQIALLIYIVRASPGDQADEGSARRVSALLFALAVVVAAVIGLWLLRSTPVGMAVFGTALVTVVLAGRRSRNR